MHKSVFPIIVIYKVRLNESECYNSFLSKLALDKFMVYDNSPSDFVQHIDDLPSNAVYVRDETNGGLSKAYNRAAKYALENGYERLLLLDQDTKFPIDMYEKMTRSEYDVCAPIVQLKGQVSFSPSVWKNFSVKGANIKPGKYSLSKYLLINSGLCVSVKLFHLAGGYNEKVRLDFADFQFMSRLSRVTDSFELLDVVALQDFSNDETDAKRLLTRYRMYLEGASNFCPNSSIEMLRIKWMVVLHTLALTKRTKSLEFLKLWFRNCC